MVEVIAQIIHYWIIISLMSFVRINGIKESLKGSYLINASSDKYKNKEWD